MAERVPYVWLNSNVHYGASQMIVVLRDFFFCVPASFHQLIFFCFLYGNPKLFLVHVISSGWGSFQSPPLIGGKFQNSHLSNVKPRFLLQMLANPSKIHRIERRKGLWTTLDENIA